MTLKNKLAEFGLWCFREMREFGPSDIDGGAAQDKAEELGLLETFTSDGDCGQHCVCNAGDTCLRSTFDTNLPIAKWTPGEPPEECRDGRWIWAYSNYWGSQHVRYSRLFEIWLFEGGNVENHHILAWMPAEQTPEPYQPEEAQS